MKYVKLAVEIKVWDEGLSASEMAAELKRITGNVCEGFLGGEVLSENNRCGWWDAKWVAVGDHSNA